MSAHDLSPLDYEDRIVAFIDVLGFADLVKESITCADVKYKIEKLIAIYKVFDWFFGRILTELINGRFFSDSFILVGRIENALYLIRETGNLCRYLLLQGFPCRGAIAAGPLHHHEPIIVGPALVDAYRAEQSVAVYARVVLDNATALIWAEECKLESTSRLRPLVKQDCDGQYFLDFLDPLWCNFLSWTDFAPTQEPIPSDPAEFLRAAYRSIQEGLIAVRGDEKKSAKYRWLLARCEKHAAVLKLILAEGQ